jgi:hypothetical protein
VFFGDILVERFQDIEQELLSFVVGGFRYGNKMRVLARSDDHLLVWIPGNMSYSNKSWNYSASTMVVFKRSEGASTGAVVICEKKPLGAELFAQHAVTIDRIFGPSFHETLRENRTIVIGNQPVAKVIGLKFGFEREAAVRRQRAMIVESLEDEISAILVA